MSLTKVSYSMINGTPINVLDYGAVGDGVADDTDAIEAALATGNNLYFPAGSYKVTRSLNFTGVIGRTISGANRYAGGTSVILGTAAIGNFPVIDFSGSNGIILKDLAIQTFGTDTCYIGVLFARPGAISSGVHTIQNVAIYGKFAQSCLYSSSSEENTYFDLHAETLVAGARSVTLIDIPEAGVTSAYKDISAPTGGNTVTRFFSGRFINLTANNSNRCFFVKTTRGLSIVGSYLNPGTIATAAVEVTTSSCVNMTSVTVEGTAEDIVKFNGLNSQIVISNCVMNGAVNSTVRGSAGSEIVDLFLNSTIEGPNAIDCNILRASTIHCFEHAVDVTVSNGNSFVSVYDPASITLGTSVGDVINIGTVGVTANIGTVTSNFVTEVPMASGAFSNVNRQKANMVVATGTSGAIDVSGFTAGSYGQELVFVFDKSYQLTLLNDKTSTVGNRIYTRTGADLVIAVNTLNAVRFVYAYGGWLQI